MISIFYGSLPAVYTGIGVALISLAVTVQVQCPGHRTQLLTHR